MRGVPAWLLNRVTGIFIFAGFIVHYYTIHYSVDVRFSTPLWVLFDLLFLLALIYHAFNGLWSISTEYIRSARLLMLAKAIILITATLLSLNGIRVIALT